MITIEKILCPVDFFPASHTAICDRSCGDSPEELLKDTTNKTHPEDLCPESEFFAR